MRRGSDLLRADTALQQIVQKSRSYFCSFALSHDGVVFRLADGDVGPVGRAQLMFGLVD